MYRKAIRDAAKTAITGASLGFSEVSIGRRTRLPAGNLPACTIYTDGEKIEPITIQSPRLFSREVELVCKIFVKEGSTVADDALDTLAYGVEDALTASGTLGLSYVKNLIPAQWDVEAEEEDSDDKYLAGELTFTCIYETLEVLT